MIAFDHMRVSFSSLEWAYAMVAVYRKLISNDEEAVKKVEGIAAQEEKSK